MISKGLLFGRKETNSTGLTFLFGKKIMSLKFELENFRKKNFRYISRKMK